jgi:hypothetical protein
MHISSRPWRPDSLVASDDDAAALRQWARPDIDRAVAAVRCGLYSAPEARREAFTLGMVHAEQIGIDRETAHAVLIQMLDDALPVFDFWAVAGAEFCRRLDASAWPRGGPWSRPVRTGEIDYWRVASFAMDRIGDVLARLLPDGREMPGCWFEGRCPDRPAKIRVSLLSGQWEAEGEGKTGRDLIALVSHLLGLKPSQAALKLARWLGVQAVRNV